MKIPALTFATVSKFQVDIINFKYRWAIKNFSFYCLDLGEKLESPTFEAGSARWYLRVRRSRCDNDKISICLCLQRDKDYRKVVKFGIYLVKKDGQEMVTVLGMELLLKIYETLFFMNNFF
jgi:hypothetical protein